MMPVVLLLDFKVLRDSDESSACGGATEVSGDSIDEVELANDGGSLFPLRPSPGLRTCGRLCRTLYTVP